MYIATAQMYIERMATFSVADARRDLAAVLALVRDQDVVIERRGERAAVVVSPEHYDRMVQALEDTEDLDAFDASLAEEGANVDWAQARADLGWE